MERDSLILAAMACAKGGPFSPVQVQKLFFLIDNHLGQRVGGPFFKFEPYNYGPFDKEVYHALNSLAQEGLVQISSESASSLTTYAMTLKGQEKGEEEFGKLPRWLQSYLQELVEFIRRLSFAELVSAIYKAYPHMKANSVFQE